MSSNREKIQQFVQLRIENGLSYRKAAKLMQVNAGDLNRVESQKKQPSKIFMQKINLILSFQKKEQK